MNGGFTCAVDGLFDPLSLTRLRWEQMPTRLESFATRRADNRQTAMLIWLGYS
jgi:hypothetical protein